MIQVPLYRYCRSSLITCQSLSHLRASYGTFVPVVDLLSTTVQTAVSLSLREIVSLHFMPTDESQSPTVVGGSCGLQTDILYRSTVRLSLPDSTDGVAAKNDCHSSFSRTRRISLPHDMELRSGMYRTYVPTSPLEVSPSARALNCALEIINKIPIISALCTYVRSIHTYLLKSISTVTYGSTYMRYSQPRRLSRCHLAAGRSGSCPGRARKPWFGTQTLIALGN